MAQINRPENRRKRLVAAFRKNSIDGFLITTAHNVYYLTGFRGEDSALLVTPDESWLLTDSRYAEEAGQETHGLKIVVRSKGMMPTAAALVQKAGVARLGIEAESLPLGRAEALKRDLAAGEVKPCTGLVERLRLVKDPGEVALIRRAVKVAQDAFLQVVDRLTVGQTEIQVARALDRAMEDLGADGPAFPTIVAAGERTSLPHARPTNRPIRKGEPVLFDWGARVEMYHSDLTRMAFPARIPTFFERLYRVVLAAQRHAVTQVRPGRTAGSLDALARGHLKAHRHGRHFGHGLGHGVGLEVHEAPAVSPSRETLLKAGMVITVEPGAYLPGRGGVRVEDLVLVTRSGHVCLTDIPRAPDSFLIKT